MHLLVDLGFAINWDRPVDCMLSWDGTVLSGRRISSGWAEKQYIFFSSGFSKSPASVTMLNAGTVAAGEKTEGGEIVGILFFLVGEGGGGIV